jgi:ABC-type Fe3+-hydroxamate transport system substrate-binding protein
VTHSENISTPLGLCASFLKRQSFGRKALPSHEKLLISMNFVTSAPRIVSLVPSVTELLVDLGLGPYLVGRTGFCIHPADVVQGIAKVGGTKDVNLAKIKKLAPTHVIVNVDENTLPTVHSLREFVPQVIVTHPQTPLDNIALIDQLLSQFAINSIAACAMNTPAVELKRQINLGWSKLQAIQKQEERVLYLIWRDPWMTVARDTYISRMLALIGWQTWPDAQGGETGAARYPVLRGDEFWLADVQRVLLSSEPYRFDASHLQEVKAWLPQATVQFVDGEMLSWYGSRAVKGLAYLAELAQRPSAPYP